MKLEYHAEQRFNTKGLKMKRPININTKRGTFSRLGTALVLGGTMLSCASTLDAGVQLSGLMGRDVTDPVDAITQYLRE